MENDQMITPAPPMNRDEETLLMIKGLVSELSPAEREQVVELADQFRKMLLGAGGKVGAIAFALIGAELQAVISHGKGN